MDSIIFKYNLTKKLMKKIDQMKVNSHFKTVWVTVRVRTNLKELYAYGYGYAYAYGCAVQYGYGWALVI